MAFKPTDYFAYDFANRRHIGPSPTEISAMLKTVGYKSLDDLISATIPDAIRQKQPLKLDNGMTERDALIHMKEIAEKNQVLTSLIGQGLLWHIHTRADFAQYLGKSSLVHGLHPLSARDCPRTVGGFVELPNYGFRFNGVERCQCFAFG